MSVDDLRAMALPALRHRLILNFEGEAAGVDVDDLVGQIVEVRRGDEWDGERGVPEVERRQSMPGPTVIERLVADVARQIRLRRAEFYGLRGLFWGAVAAVLPLLLKESLGRVELRGRGACSCWPARPRVPATGSS